jgi:hypothetical protein
MVVLYIWISINVIINGNSWVYSFTAEDFKFKKV